MSRMIGVIGGISGEILCDRLHERGFQCLLIAGRECPIRKCLQSRFCCRFV